MKFKVLLVDDARDWRTILSGLITDFFPEATVVTASSISEARQSLVEEPPDLAIIDIRLVQGDESDIGGLEIAQFIREQQLPVHVFITTGYPNLETVRKAMQPNADGYRMVADFIEKDQVQEELISKIRNLIGEK